MRVKMDLHMEGNHISVESFQAVFKIVKTKIVQAIYETLKEESRFKQIPNQKLKKEINRIVRFDIEESYNGSFGLVALSASLIFIVGIIVHKYSISGIEKQMSDIDKLIKEKEAKDLLKTTHSIVENLSINEKIERKLIQKFSNMSQHHLKIDVSFVETDLEKIIIITIRHNKKPNEPMYFETKEAMIYLNELDKISSKIST